MSIWFIICSEYLLAEIGLISHNKEFLIHKLTESCHFNFVIYFILIKA